MTPDDASKVLLLVSVYDNRQFDDMTARAWADALDGLDLGDCLDAVKQYFKRSRAWLMPADIREQARIIILDRRQRDAQAAELSIPAIESAATDPDVVADRIETLRKAIADACQMPAVDSPHPKCDARRERQARTVPCPWCKAPEKSACSNTATGRPTSVIHEARFVAAGLVVAS